MGVGPSRKSATMTCVMRLCHIPSLLHLFFSLRMLQPVGAEAPVLPPIRWMGVNVHTVSIILGFGAIVRVVCLAKCTHIIVLGLCNAFLSS